MTSTTRTKKPAAVTVDTLPTKTGMMIVALDGFDLPVPQFGSVYVKADGIQVVFGLAQTVGEGEDAVKQHAFIVPKTAKATVVTDPASFPADGKGVRYCSNVDRHEGAQPGDKFVRYVRAHGDDNVTAYCDCRKVRAQRKREAAKAAEAAAKAAEEKAAEDKIAKAAKAAQAA